MKTLLRHLFTGKDNKTYDIGRFLWLIMCLSYIAITVYSIYKGGIVDYVLWAAGAASLLASGGAALGLKQGVEPEPMMIKTDKYTFQTGRMTKSYSEDGGGDDPDDDDDEPDAPDNPVLPRPGPDSLLAAQPSKTRGRPRKTHL